MSTDSPNFTPATIAYQGTYKGATVSGRVPVWSLPTAPDEAARLLYAVITGRSLHKEGRRVNWACGAEDFSAWVPSPRRDGGRVTNFLHFTFRIEMNPSRSAPRGVRVHPSDKETVILPVADPVTLPTECDEVAASISDKAPRFTTFDEACAWVRARMPGESCTIIDNTAESLMTAQRHKAPTPAPTFTDDIPEPAFDILSDESGKGARSVVIFRRMGLDVVDFIASSSLLSSHKIPGDVLAWQSFRTDDGWSWYRSGQWVAKDSAGLFLP